MVAPSMCKKTSEHVEDPTGCRDFVSDYSKPTIYIPNLDLVVSTCWPSSPGDFTSKAKLLPSTI